MRTHPRDPGHPSRPWPRTHGSSTATPIPPIRWPAAQSQGLELAGGQGGGSHGQAAGAAFTPLRRRVQDLVDRRFDRRRYDAARTVQAFTVRLRDQVDLDSLSAERLAIVDQTCSR